MKTASTPRDTRHLSVVSSKDATSTAWLTRGQVATRLGVSVSTVRRYEGDRLHPRMGEDDVRWFDDKEVASLAAALANEPRAVRRRNGEDVSGAPTPQRTQGEIAAQVFERLEQRQSLAEIVIGVRVDPDVVRALHEQWSLGLIEGQLRREREPRLQRETEVVHVRRDELADRLAKLPSGQATRISVGLYRGSYQHGEYLYPEVVELGGFLVAGPCTLHEIVCRFGAGDYRVTAYGFEPAGLRWECLVNNLQ